MKSVNNITAHQLDSLRKRHAYQLYCRVGCKVKTKIAEYRETSLLTARGIADLVAVFRYAMSGVMADKETLGVIQ